MNKAIGSVSSMLSLTAVLLSATGSATAECPTSFGAPTSYATGSAPIWVATGDFNEDGYVDVAVANRASATVSVLLGNSSGTLQPALNKVVGSEPYTVVVGDFDADGHLDLATANAGSSSVSVLTGNGDGTFKPAVNYAVGSQPMSIAIADFDVDGDLDLGVVGLGNSNVAILAGNGDGTFQRAINHPIGFTSHAVAAGDFNADGKADLAITDYFGDKVTVLIGVGDGTFQAGVNYPAANGTFAITVADLNADGRQDLSVASTDGSGGPGMISILFGDGFGGFQAAINYNGGNAPYMVAAADFNGDAKLDLAVPNSIPAGSVSVLSGAGNGTFQPLVTPFAVNNPMCAATADFNGDGRPDLAVANYQTDTVSVVLNTSNPSFTAPTIVQQPAGIQFVQAGMSATLSIVADGHGNALTFQWRRNGVPIAGATLASLTFGAAQLSDNACYDVLVKSPACGGGFLVTASASAILAVNGCIGDVNGDGTTDGTDLGILLGAWGPCL